MNVFLALLKHRESGIFKSILVENNLFIDWVYFTLQKLAYKNHEKNTKWNQCNFGHLYKLICEVQKENIDCFSETEENEKITFIICEFVNPIKTNENFEYSKEKDNLSDLIELDGEMDMFEFEKDEQEETDLGTKTTDFLIEFTNKQRESRHENDTEIDKDETDDGEIVNMDFGMAYSNKRIEQFSEMNKTGNK